jgi:uncharacterized protein involved in response to NO
MNNPRFQWSVFFSYGFRPFFLFACIFAALSMGAWLTWIGLHAMNAQVLRPTIAVPPHEWHAHEMLFGYSLAVITGFFLTAIPNWTGAKPVNGLTLVILSGVWLAGRVAIWFSAYLPAALVAVIDLAFIPLLLVLVAKALFKRWAPRNFVFIPILTLLFIANLLAHAEWMELMDDVSGIAYRLALGTVILLITIIGGRVVPAFTTNALRRLGHERLPASHKVVDILSVASVGAIIVVDLIAPYGTVAGAITALAALANAMRLAGWRGLQTLGEPIVWVLHLAYAWLVVGLGFKAAAYFDLLSEATAIHALTVGAVGSMTLAVMTRASLGHTGRALQIAPPITFAFVLISLSAILRVAVPAWAPQFYNEAMVIAGGLWMLAYIIVLVIFWPILTLPRNSARAAEND